MSILIDHETQIVVQGITGEAGQFHTKQMKQYGSQVMAGVRPGKGGEWVHGVPVFDTVHEAIMTTGANTSLVCVPAPNAADAIMEAADAGISLIICVTEGIPLLDMARATRFLDQTGARLIGPNSPGIISPGKSMVGIMPPHIYTPGNVGIISRSGTLAYEFAMALTGLGLGQSTMVGIGSDPISGSSSVDILRLFELDPLTEHIVLVGEIGGTDEQEAARFIGLNMATPVTAFIAGHTAPSNERLGHIGAIIQREEETAAAKIKSLENVGVQVATLPSELAPLVKSRMPQGSYF